ncbi:MAG: M20/M25/M40 family metallo-hydrolase, partial [Rhodospirillaceae bacterium]
VVRGQEGQWKDGRDPWVLARDGERVYGRGTADNKGQHSIHLGALRAVIETRGRLGFNSKFMIETGEENGSKGLKQLVAEHKDDFAADVYFASDGPRVDIARPNLTLGCRGTHNLDLLLEMREGGHHSGNWGGLLANPGVILSHAIATIVDAKGRILVDGLQPPPITNSVREALKDVKREDGPNAPEIDPEWGEPGLTAPEKVYAWNTFEVLAFKTGNPDRPVNAVPPWARANCQLRYVLGTDPDGIRPALRKHLDEKGFNNVRIVDPLAGNDAIFVAARTDPDHPWARWMLDALTRVSGEKPNVLPNSGGSICNDVFQDVLGIPFVWMPLSYTGCSQHAPNEHIIWPLTRDGMRLVTGVYWELGDPATAYRAQ